MENFVVYRARFEDAGTAIAAKSGERVVTQETNAAPAGAAIPSQ